METLLRTVLNLSGTGAVVICVVLLIRLLLKRAPKRYSYWLWSAAAFRLVCPVSFRSAFSVFSLAPAAVSPASTADAGAAAPAISFIPPAVGAVQTPAAALPLPTVGETVSAALPAAGAASAAAASTAPSLLFVLGLIWLAGAAALLIWGAVSYARLAGRLRTAVRLYEGVWQSDAVDSPFLLGFLRPHIYIPFGLEAEKLDYVLAHEQYHISHRDYFVKLMGFLILALHWFNPLVWLAFVLMGRDMEMRCDEAVLGRGAAASKPYSETLLSFAVGGRFPRPGPLAFGESGVKARIRNALRWKKPKVWVTVCAALLCAAAVAACAANPAKPDGETPPEETKSPEPAATATPTETARMPSGPGANSSVEMYIRNEVLREYESNGVTLFRPDGSAVRVDVAQTELSNLQITGTLDGLAPDGQLQSWRYRLRLVLAEDAPALAPVGDMTEENGRYVLNWTHNVVALVYPNDRMDVLYDQPVNDDMTFLGYHLSYEDAIYDWYVTAYRLDLPLCVMDWGTALSAGGSYPVQRYDGDGWYLYVPVSGWKLTEASETRTKWESVSDSGSTLVVRRASAEERAAERPALTDGQAERFIPTGDGDYWLVFTQYDPKILIYSSWVGKEPEILQLMAESFRAGGAAETNPAEVSLRSEVDMLGEQLISTAGEAGEWWDVRTAFADRWCEKHLNASADNPRACMQCGIWEIGTYLDAISLTSAPRRLAFNVSLTVSPRDEAAFIEASAGWCKKMPDGRYRIGTEAVLVSDDGVHWTVEALNSGGSAGWGWRNRTDDNATENVRYALENDEPIILLRFLPNLDWSELSDEETARTMEMLQDAALADGSGTYGENEQLYRDLYMLWGFKRSDGAYAELYLDGPYSILARQYRADPETFLAALAEMDDATQALVRQGLGI